MNKLITIGGGILAVVGLSKLVNSGANGAKQEVKDATSKILPGNGANPGILDQPTVDPDQGSNKQRVLLPQSNNKCGLNGYKLA